MPQNIELMGVAGAVGVVFLITVWLVKYVMDSHREQQETIRNHLSHNTEAITKLTATIASFVDYIKERDSRTR